jgi:hypothetical protein
MPISSLTLGSQGVGLGNEPQFSRSQKGCAPRFAGLAVENLLGKAYARPQNDRRLWRPSLGEAEK